ncbi:unnamed protein product [Phytophthora lilii]|uniref:Unnamed protein product n=1 Tax=Phytophthora lilii TaxID=2077276 RepID=A0A9W6XFR0_9STRA|nr:unnamed protein product [Phytophthora lilii]
MEYVGLRAAVESALTTFNRSRGRNQGVTVGTVFGLPEKVHEKASTPTRSGAAYENWAIIVQERTEWSRHKQQHITSLRMEIRSNSKEVRVSLVATSHKMNGPTKSSWRATLAKSLSASNALATTA